MCGEWWDSAKWCCARVRYFYHLKQRWGFNPFSQKSSKLGAFTPHLTGKGPNFYTIPTLWRLPGRRAVCAFTPRELKQVARDESDPARAQRALGDNTLLFYQYMCLDTRAHNNDSRGTSSPTSATRPEPGGPAQARTARTAPVPPRGPLFCGLCAVRDKKSPRNSEHHNIPKMLITRRPCFTKYHPPQQSARNRVHGAWRGLLSKQGV